MTELAKQTDRLRADKLSCRRGGRLLFENLDVVVSPGELLQIAGPNGCGKSTLLRILCGLRTADSGTVFWQERDIQDAQDEFRSQLIFIGFHSGIKLDLTPRENLAFIAAIGTAIEAKASVNIDQALEGVGLLLWADTPCRQLSTGQIRRATLARLAMLNCPLWILDEPLTGLDTQAQGEMESSLFRHAQKGGMVVFTSHHSLGSNHPGLRLLELGR